MDGRMEASGPQKLSYKVVIDNEMSSMTFRRHLVLGLIEKIT